MLNSKIRAAVVLDAAYGYWLVTVKRVWSCACTNEQSCPSQQEDRATDSMSRHCWACTYPAMGKCAISNRCAALCVYLAMCVCKTWRAS